ncbi:glycogen synthase [Saliterribacillus persicus]|nr:glycogen/starch synthase [Saliterribacillus persicus]
MGKKVLFVASECTPFVKTGGLADVIGSLPQALQQTENIDVSVMLPLYQEIWDNWQNQLTKINSLPLNVGWRKHDATIYHTTHQGIPFYFIKNDYYFSRHGVYGYEDDGERYLFFCQAVMEALKVIDFEADILHAHDWQAGLAIAFANITPPTKQLKTVFTIHNIKYQGILLKDAYADLFNISDEHIGGLEWDGLLNCMKSGIFHADKITTVSPTYAEEITFPFYGEGLDSIIRERKNDVIGILNGIDLNDYNPNTDPHLNTKYSYSRIKKKENKEILQKKLGLKVDPEIPMYVMITRLVEQKGLHLVQAILDEFLNENVQFVLLGTGDYEFENFFYHAEKRNKEKLVSYLGFDEALARQIYASGDFFVMPSLFEPCGLSQLIALQYKTVPIVRETGGLKDTVTPFNEYSLEGNGFSFKNYNAHELLEQLKYSLSIYQNEEKWQALLKNVNKSYYSWDDSAHAYADLYHELHQA